MSKGTRFNMSQDVEYIVITEDNHGELSRLYPQPSPEDIASGRYKMIRPSITTKDAVNYARLCEETKILSPNENTKAGEYVNKNMVWGSV